MTQPQNRERPIQRIPAAPLATAGGFIQRKSLTQFDLVCWLLFRASLVRRSRRIDTIYRLTESLNLPEHRAQKVRRWATALVVAYGEEEKADLYA